MSEVLSIVINNNVVRIAQLRRVRGGMRVKRLLEKECPKKMVDDSTVLKPDSFAGYLKLMLNNAGIHTRDVIFTLPADKVMTREIVLPDMNDARLKQIVSTNAGEYFPINLDDYVISYYRIASVRQQEQAPADGAPKQGNASVPEGEQASDELVNDEDVEITTFENPDAPGKKKKKKERRKAPRRAKKKRGGDNQEKTAEEQESRKKKKERGQVRLMAVAAPNEMVQSLYETAEHMHMHVDSIDFVGNSAFRLAQFQVDKTPTLTVDISGDHTAMTFFDNGDMIMQRNVDFGLDQIVEIVAREKWVSEERAEEMLRTSAIIDEDMPASDPVGEQLHFAIDMIRRTMMYYTRNRGMQPVERVLLMGDAVYYRGLRDLLEAQLSVPVRSVDQLRGVAIPRTSLMHDQAMRYLDNYGAIISPVGFLSQELSRKKKESSGKHIYRTILMAGLLGSAIVIAVPTVQYVTLRKKRDELSSKVVFLKSADKLLSEYNEAKLRGDDVRNVEGLTASNNDYLLDFIVQLEEVRPRGVYIETFTIDEGEITMSVLASGKEVIAAMLRGLETMDNVSEVEASALTSFYDGGQETVSCTISCMLNSKEKQDYEATRTEEASGQ